MLRLMPSSGQAQQVLPRLLSQQHQWPPAPLDHLLYRKHWLSKPRCWLQRQLELPQRAPQLEPAIAEAIQRAKAAAALVACPAPTLGLLGSLPLAKPGSVGLAPPGAYPMRPGYIGKAMRPALGSPVKMQAVVPGVVPQSPGMTAGSSLLGCPIAAASSKSGSHATSIPQVSPKEASAAIGLAAAQLAGLVSQHMSGPAAVPAENCMALVSNQEGESAGDAESKNFDMGGFATMKEVSPALAALMAGSLG